MRGPSGRNVTSKRKAFRLTLLLSLISLGASLTTCPLGIPAEHPRLSSSAPARRAGIDAPGTSAEKVTCLVAALTAQPACPELPADAASPDDVPLPSAARAFTPEGLNPDELPGRVYRTKAGWLFCQRDDCTPEQLHLVRRAVYDHRDAFAYSLADLPGYNGPVGPMRIPLKDEKKPLFQGRRTHSALENEIADEKCNELKNVGFLGA